MQIQSQIHIKITQMHALAHIHTHACTHIQTNNKARQHTHIHT